jgi:hypothetical protein
VRVMKVRAKILIRMSQDSLAKTNFPCLADL